MHALANMLRRLADRLGPPVPFSPSDEADLLREIRQISCELEADRQRLFSHWPRSASRR